MKQIFKTFFLLLVWIAGSTQIEAAPISPQQVVQDNQSIIVNKSRSTAFTQQKENLFRDVYAHDISFSNESCQVEPVLNDLTGEIVFEEGGNKTSALTGAGELIDIYESLYISYSGDEDVEFTILVNNRNLLEDEDLSQFVSWDEDNNRYVVFLYGLIFPFGNQYSAHLAFDVTVHAMGYNDLYQYHSSFVSWVLDTSGLRVLESGYTDLSYFIEIDYDYSIHYCNLDSVYPNYNNEDWNKSLYALPRLDHDYSITVIAGHKTPMSTVYSYIENTVLIPARECNIAISEYDSIKPNWMYSIIENGACFYTEEVELGKCFAIIESYSFADDLQLSITVDDQLVWNNTLYTVTAAINLLPFGDIYGGEHHIEAAVADGYNSLIADTVLEIHPIATRLTRDSLILDIGTNMNNIILFVNGEEVELSTDGYYYALERLAHDYSVTVQAGVKITNEWGEDYSGWSKETTIIIPSKCIGDVDDNGLINIGDVTALIDYLHNSDASVINLSNADCDGNGLLNIADVTSLIDYLLSGTWP